MMRTAVRHVLIPPAGCRDRRMIRNAATRPLPVKLICPRCRWQETEQAVIFLQRAPDVDSEGSVLFCPRCAAKYPSLEGVLCLPRDVEAFRRTQAWALAPDWLPESRDRVATAAACAALAARDPGSSEFSETLLPAIYTLAHFPASVHPGHLAQELAANETVFSMLSGWLERHMTIGPAMRFALDVGCGPGGMLHALAPHFRDGVVGLDLRFSMLRVARRLLVKGKVGLPFRTEGRRFEFVRIKSPRALKSPIYLVQGDIETFPFEDSSFPVVVALSLLDTVADPIFVLNQLDMLIEPGGLLMVALPYSWEARVTEPANWWSTPEATGSQTLRLLLAGRHPALPHLAYRILEETKQIAWTLPGHNRLVHRYWLDVVLARKTNQAGDKRARSRA